MTFFHPLALLGALLAIPILLCYGCKVHARRQPVSTGFLWGQVFTPHRPRALWSRWRLPVSLGVQLAVLLLLVLALAEPYLRRPSRRVLVIDNSASMSATDVQPTRLERAKELARQQIPAMGYRDELAIITGGDRVETRASLTGRKPVLEEAIEAIAPTPGATRVTEAVGLARRLQAGSPRDKVVIFSDGCFPGAAELAKAEDVQFISIGGSGDNAASIRVAPGNGVHSTEEADMRVPVELRGRAELAAVGAAGPPPWPFVAAVALLLLVVEWCLFQRRWIC
jgi:hypothetical protein